MEIGVEWEDGPREGVEGGVEDGVGLSTTHILEGVSVWSQDR